MTTPEKEILHRALEIIGRLIDRLDSAPPINHNKHREIVEVLLENMGAKWNYNFQLFRSRYRAEPMVTHRTVAFHAIWKVTRYPMLTIAQSIDGTHIRDGGNRVAQACRRVEKQLVIGNQEWTRLDNELIMRGTALLEKLGIKL